MKSLSDWKEHLFPLQATFRASNSTQGWNFKEFLFHCSRGMSGAQKMVYGRAGDKTGVLISFEGAEREVKICS